MSTYCMYQAEYCQVYKWDGPYSDFQCLCLLPSLKKTWVPHPRNKEDPLLRTMPTLPPSTTLTQLLTGLHLCLATAKAPQTIVSNLNLNVLYNYLCVSVLCNHRYLLGWARKSYRRYRRVSQAAPTPVGTFGIYCCQLHCNGINRHLSPGLARISNEVGWACSVYGIGRGRVSYRLRWVPTIYGFS